MGTVSRRAVIVSIASLALGIAGCGVVGPSNPNPACVPNGPGACSEIDGFPVGQLEADCHPDGLACGKEEQLAYLALSARERILPPIVGITRPGVDIARVCGPTLCAYTTYNAIFVFTLANGSLRAAGYQCQGVGPCVGTLHWSDFSDVVGTE